MAPVRNARSFALAAVLLAAFWFVADHGVADKSTTFDEMAHLTAGYSYWRTGDHRLNPENGWLPQRWDALPLTRYSPAFPSLDTDAWRRAESWQLGYRFFYDEGNDLARMLRSGRRANLVFALLLGAVVFAWSLRLFGPVGALVSLSLFVLDPNVIAHGSLITSDMAAALAFTIAIAALGWCVEKPGLPQVLIAAAALTALALSKTSWILIVPMGIVLIAIRTLSSGPLVGWMGRPLRTATRSKLVVLIVAATIVCVLVWAGIWAAYGWRYRSPGMEADVHNWSQLLPQLGTGAGLIDLARRGRWLPESYLWGIAYGLRHAQSRQTFFLGTQSSHGWWYFFPLAFLMKTPVGTLALLATAAGIGCVRYLRLGRDQRMRWARRLAPLLVLLISYWLAAMSSSLNIGVRHLLPTYGALYILAGASVGAATCTPRRRVWPVLALLVALAGIESLRIHPHHLAFFNVLAGGPSKGHTRLVDSNLDWGQDLPGLARRLAQPDVADRQVYLSYFGTGRPSYYGIRAHGLPSFFDPPDRTGPDTLEGGIYCISATNLQNLTNPVPELRGSWTAEHEARFQLLREEIHDGAPSRRIAMHSWRIYEALRFARLTAYLRQRRPDETIGYSILIFHLSDADVREAIEGPLADLQAAS
jgi:hypothetical protein